MSRRGAERNDRERRAGLLTIHWVLLLALAAGPGCEPALSAPQEVFREVAAETGLSFFFVNGMTGKLYYHEIMGAGCALVDYDNDGDLDAFLVQGHPIPEGFDYRSALPAPQEAGAHRDRLFRNDPGSGDKEEGLLRWTDVTTESGLAATGYGMGVAVGDVNNDGHLDIYITNYGPDQLWRNNGDGTFSDHSREAGVDSAGFTVSSSLFDYDRDGWLDLYVTSYIDYSKSNHKTCRHSSGAPDYCSPSAYRHLPDRLYHNRGNGTFEDVTQKMGMDRVQRSGLGVVTTDVDGDGFLDIYVGNDMAANFLWMNGRGLSFADEAVFRGAALSGAGRAEASMGVEAGDYNGDGLDDILAAHMNQQMNTLYVNLGGGLFDDRSGPSGLGPPGWRHTTYAPAWLDYDNDGLLDLFALNGGMILFNDVRSPGDPQPLADPNQLFRNLGGGRFEEVKAAPGSAMSVEESGRGVSVGDVDNDGDADLLINNNDGPVRLLLNQIGSRNHWLGLRLVDEKGRRDMLGAYVELTLPGASPMIRRANTDGGYGSSKDPRVLFGLGSSPEINGAAVRVRWPDGRLEEFSFPGVDGYCTLKKGTGRSFTGPSLLRPGSSSRSEAQ